MTDEAAELFEWARRADTTAAAAWAAMQTLNEETEWDPEQMLADIDAGDSTSSTRRETPQ